MSFLAGLLDDFLSLLFPRICYGCGNHLVRNEYLICTECHAAIPRTNYHLSDSNPVEQLFWGRCQVKRAAAFSFYNKGSRIRRLIHNLKYKGIRELGPELGSIYGSLLRSSDFLSGIDFIIPVPLHQSRKRSRGYNQSEAIAEGLSQATGIPVEKKVLMRASSSQTQTKRSRYDRWTNVQGIFQVINPELIRNRHILLVDDVITTGSTIEACVNELLMSEGVKVSVVSLAYAAV